MKVENHEQALPAPCRVLAATSSHAKAQPDCGHGCGHVQRSNAVAPAVGQTILSPGLTLDRYGPANLGALRMEGGTIIFRDGQLGPATATNSTLMSGWIAAAGYSAQPEF